LIFKIQFLLMELSDQWYFNIKFVKIFLIGLRKYHFFMEIEK